MSNPDWGIWLFEGATSVTSVCFCFNFNDSMTLKTSGLKVWISPLSAHTHSLHNSFPEGKKIEGLFFHLRLQSYTGYFKLVKIKLIPSYLAWQAKVFGAQGKVLFFKRNNCPVLLISEAAAEGPLWQKFCLTLLQQRSTFYWGLTLAKPNYDCWETQQSLLPN